MFPAFTTTSGLFPVWRFIFPIRTDLGCVWFLICSNLTQFPAYTLVWTRQGSGKLPSRAMDFNGILTIQNVRPEDAGVYVCTGSNMFDMDEGTAVLYVPGS